MKRRILSFLCAVALLLGMVTVPAFATDASDDLQSAAAVNGTEKFSSLQAAVNDYTSGVIVLQEDAQDITVPLNVYLDLNGHDVAGVTVNGGATLFVSDTQTADYSVADGYYGVITDVAGEVAAAEGYLAVTEAEGLSFHCVDLQIKSMSLRPGNAGVYYTSNFAGDEVVSEQVLSYGIALSVAAEPTAENIDTLCGYSAITGFEAGSNAATGTLLTDIMSEDNTAEQNAVNAAMPIYGRAYIKTAGGYTFGSCVSRDLQEQLEAIDTVFENLSENQKAGILAMYGSYKSVMSAWNVPNIRGSQLGDTVITVPVQSENGVVTETVTVEQDGVSITIPFGTLLEAGSTELTLNITKKQTSDSGIEAAQGQTLMPFDVHVEGVSSENTVPLTVALGKVMPENLNMGNYTVYHVEESGTNPMELVANDAEFTDHNQYKYTLDGELTLHMATFSEVAVVSEDVNGWKNGVDHSWYLDTIAKATEEGTTETYFEIRNADQLWSFSQIVGGMTQDANGTSIVDSEGNVIQDSFDGKTVTLLADINLADAEDTEDTEKNNGVSKIFYPIGYYNSEGTYEKDPNATEGVTSGFYTFEGTFDGNGNTISNIYQNTWEMKGDHNWYDAKLQYYRDGMGLFGKVYGGSVKNLTVDNFSSDGEITTTGVIAAYADCGATFENIAITNCNPRVYNIGNGGIVGCAGWYANDGVGEQIIFRNITVDQSNKISALWGSYDVSCGGILGQYYPVSGQSSATDNQGVYFENCHVAAIMDVNNDVCANYQYYWYRYSGMFIGTIRDNTTDGVYTVANTAEISAEDCTYTLGDWNEYWYCELVKNSLASYTHDHQFSRLTTISDLSEIQDEAGNWDTEGNFVIPNADNTNAECYHIFKNDEGNLYQHKHEDSGYETTDVDGDGVVDSNLLKEDRQCYFMPFNQVFNGLGYGVKPTYAFEGIKDTTGEDGALVASEEKFDAILVDTTITTGTEMPVKELFAFKAGANISQPTIHVFVSPVGEKSTVEAKYVCVSDGSFANIPNLTFTGIGAAKITITDYYFCTPTVLNVTVAEPADVDKFEAVEGIEVNAEEPIELSRLFEAIEGAEIDDANVTVASDSAIAYENNADDWTKSTVTFNETGSVVVTITDNNRCVTATATVTVKPINKFALVFKNTDDYLYRVGNASNSPVALGTLFAAVDETVSITDVKVAVDQLAGNASGDYTENATWTSGKIQFSDTGVVAVTISATNANPLTLNLEVVDAKNVTTAESATANNVVLLNNASGGFSVSGNHTFYGNGFTVTLPTSSVTDKGNGFCGYVNLSNGHLDNVRIVGPVYPEAYIYRTQAEITDSSDPDYGDGDNMRYFHNSVIINAGDCNITNSYISGSRAAIYVKDGGNVVIEDTTVSGGSYANIQVAVADSVTFRNLTTEQKEVEDDYNAEGSKKNVIGLGIVVDSADAEINIDGTLEQYNWITEAQWDAMLGSYADKFPDLFGDSTYEKYWHYRENDTTKYVNLTLIFACNWDENKLHDEREDTGYYTDTGVTIVSTSGAVYSVAKAGTLTDALFYAPVYKATAQYPVAPVPVFDHMADENYVAVSGTADDPNAYCYEDADVVKISFSKGKQKDWYTSILSVKKGTEEIPYTVSMNDIDYTGEAITFTEAGAYVVKYTYTDPYNYKLDENGAIVSYEKTYEQIVNITVSVVEDTAENAEFTMGTNGNAVEEILIGNNTYLSARGLDNSDWTSGTGLKFPQSDGDTSTISFKYSGNSNGNWASATINGQTFYFPVVAMGTTDSTFKHYSSWYGCFPVFEGAITITDYADGGTGAEQVYNSSTTTMPTNLSALYPQTVFRYQGTQSKVPTTPSKMTSGTYNGMLCYTTQTDLSASNERSEEWNLATYTYTDNKGTTYYWYVAYYCEASTNGLCVTGDTLVALADGTQKEIQYVTYEDQLLVWNFFTGKYDVAPAAIIFNHGYDTYRVLKLNFSDGTSVKAINNHGFYDVDADAFVFIDEYNAESYIGHSFVKVDGDGKTHVELVSYEAYEEYTGSYSIQTAQHNNFMVEGLFSITMPAYEGWFDYFEIGEGMKYDEEKMQADIEKYGLYTYEDFAEYVTYEQFIAFNGPYLKVLVGRGVVTFEQILELIETYVP